MRTQKVGFFIACSVALFLFFSAFVRHSTERMAEEKSELRRELQSSISAMDNELERLRRERDDGDRQERETIQGEIDRLEHVRNDVCQQVSDLGDISGEEWSMFHHKAIGCLDRARKALAEMRGPVRS